MQSLDVAIRYIKRRKSKWLGVLRGISRRQQFLIVTILVWILLLWFGVRLPQQETVEQTPGVYHQDTFTQSDLDYFAQTIQLNYSVQENWYKNGNQHKARVELTNTGNRLFPWKDWSITFCSFYVVEPGYFPYPNGLDKPKNGIRIFSLGGGVYRIEPLEDVSKSIAPGKHRSFNYIGMYSSISKSDNFPNWYFAVEGLDPRIIESTRGDSFDWVAEYDTPNLWKRQSDIEEEDFDYYDPYTPQERFDHGITDTKEALLPVIPMPADVVLYKPSTTVNVLAGDWVIVTSNLLANEANYLSDVWGLRVVTQNPDQEYISFIEQEIKVTAHGKELPTDESYEVSVSPVTKAITIKASKPAGAFYGIQTLMSIADAQGNVPQAVIRDAPRYEYRGIMLDVARNFQSREKIFRYIDVMAMYKINKFHFHLTDDEGWRIAIPGLPELTEIGAHRCHDPTGTKCLLPYLGAGPFDGPPGSGFYTMEDYRAILRYAALHHIEVIPEVDVPGHMNAGIKAMNYRRKKLLEQGVNITEASRFLLEDLQDKSSYKSIQGFTNNTINPCLQSTYTFLSRIINSMYAMHRDINPLKVFHFGGDEVAKGAWTKSPVCKRLRASSGVTTSWDEYLTMQISNMTSLYNLDLAGWEDGFMFHDNVPMTRDVLKNKNVYAYAWNNVWEHGIAKNAYNLANNGFKVVLTPATTFYFDHPQEPDPKEKGLYWASRFTNTLDVYSFVPENMYWNALTKRSGMKFNDFCNDRGKKNCPELIRKENIAGIQGSLFGEMLRNQQVTDSQLLPRLIALADRAWHETSWENEPNKEKRNEAKYSDWTSFANTLGHKELARLDKMGYKYRIPLPGGKIDGDTVQVNTEFPGLPVEISHDNGKTWQEINSTYTTSIPIGSPCMLRTRSAFGKRYSRSVSLTAAEATTHKSGSRSREMPLLLMCILMALHYCFT